MALAHFLINKCCLSFHVALACPCPKGHRNLRRSEITTSSSGLCVQCPKNFGVYDKYFCIECPDEAPYNSTTGKCNPCANGHVQGNFFN